MDYTLISIIAIVAILAMVIFPSLLVFKYKLDAKVKTNKDLVDAEVSIDICENKKE